MAEYLYTYVCKYVCMYACNFFVYIMYFLGIYLEQNFNCFKYFQICVCLLLFWSVCLSVWLFVRLFCTSKCLSTLNCTYDRAMPTTDEQDWLFFGLKKKRQSTSYLKKVKTSSGCCCCNS